MPRSPAPQRTCGPWPWSATPVQAPADSPLWRPHRHRARIGPVSSPGGGPLEEGNRHLRRRAEAVPVPHRRWRGAGGAPPRDHRRAGGVLMRAPRPRRARGQVLGAGLGRGLACALVVASLIIDLPAAADQLKGGRPQAGCRAGREPRGMVVGRGLGLPGQLPRRHGRVLRDHGPHHHRQVRPGFLAVTTFVLGRLPAQSGQQRFSALATASSGQVPEWGQVLARNCSQPARGNILGEAVAVAGPAGVARPAHEPGPADGANDPGRQH